MLGETINFLSTVVRRDSYRAKHDKPLGRFSTIETWLSVFEDVGLFIELHGHRWLLMSAELDLSVEPCCSPLSTGSRRCLSASPLSVGLASYSRDDRERSNRPAMGDNRLLHLLWATIGLLQAEIFKLLM
jgi:hypothetical protein